MARVFIPPQLRDLTSGTAELDLTAGDVRQVVTQLEERYPGIAARLVRDDELAPNLQVSVDGVLSRRGLAAKLQPASEVHFLPIFGGG